uniref:NACHT, LRR and PYD domains-containing protein 1b allele 2-like n=1 Tax=Labrus bergylta TaxID=56723 RepID=A0A3Q3M1T9_9LABR
MLIFKKKNTFLKLKVYLIPCDPGLRQEILKIEKNYKNKEIEAPPENMHLRMKDHFILSTDMDGAVIRPKEVKLEYQFTDPPYFQVRIRNPDTDFILKLTKKKESTPVWTCTIDEDDYQSNSHAPAARPSAGAAGVDTTSDDQHFVDKYKLQLTDKVSHMDPILDRLLDRGVLQREAYDTIRALPTSQKKMRELYCGCLQAGAASKDIFYQILLENEKFLIDDLNTKH